MKSNSKSPDDNQWLRTDEIEEFIDAIEHSSMLAERLNSDPKAWKWLIISLHSTLQGACVCALRGLDTSGVTFLEKKSQKEVWHWLDVESHADPAPPMPREKLANLLDLFKRVRNKSILEAPFTLVVSNNVINDVKKLNVLRNEFIHFVPKGLSLALAGMPRITEHVCDAGYASGEYRGGIG
jgi:hypothetical protein